VLHDLDRERAGDGLLRLTAGRREAPGDQVVALANRRDRLHRDAVAGDVSVVVDPRGVLHEHHVESDGRADGRATAATAATTASAATAATSTAAAPGAQLDREAGRDRGRV